MDGSIDEGFGRRLDIVIGAHAGSREEFGKLLAAKLERPKPFSHVAVGDWVKNKGLGKRYTYEGILALCADWGIRREWMVSGAQPAYEEGRGPPVPKGRLTKPGIVARGNSEAHLLDIYRRLSPADQRHLIRHAEGLIALHRLLPVKRFPQSE